LNGHFSVHPIGSSVGDRKFNAPMDSHLVLSLLFSTRRT
jgi:hypothetical protein